MQTGIAQKQQFQDRLQRVAAGGANTLGHVYCGITVPESKPERKKSWLSRDKPEKQARSGASLPVSLITGLIIGASAVLLSRFLRFKLTGGSIAGNDADITMVTDIVVAITIAILLRIIFRFKSKIHGVAKLTGVTATVLLMHNVVHVAPGIFEQVYSPNWVKQVVANTQANSILVAGVSYEFPVPKDSEVKISALIN
ncbi:MAG: hypothetical protein V3V25_06405 [Paracoccaceae bacterium]